MFEIQMLKRFKVFGVVLSLNSWQVVPFPIRSVRLPAGAPISIIRYEDMVGDFQRSLVW